MLHELAELTVLDEGDPNSFRVRAYESAAQSIKAHGSELGKLSVAELQKIESAITQSVFDVLTVERSVASRTSLGGTAPVRVRQAAKAARKRFL